MNSAHATWRVRMLAVGAALLVLLPAACSAPAPGSPDAGDPDAGGQTATDAGMDAGPSDGGGTDGGDADGGEVDGGGANDAGFVIPPAPVLGKQLDRDGRPTINTFLIHTLDPSATSRDQAKDSYNAAAPSDWPAFAQAMQQTLPKFDALDGVCGNQVFAGMALDATRYQAHATLLADDRLLLDTEANPGTCHLYGVELDLAQGTSGQCGGRPPADDVIDDEYSLWIAGAPSGVSDGVPANDVPFGQTFPYFAAPH